MGKHGRFGGSRMDIVLEDDSYANKRHLPDLLTGEDSESQS